MSDPFTDPTTDGFELFKTANLNELLLAYSERRQALGQSAVGNIGDYNTDASKTSLWSDMQEWIEANLTSFVDHTQEPFTGQATFPTFDLSTFRSAAGLNANGFRREPAGTWDGFDAIPYQYGIQQDYDMIWWWTYDDLQKAFSTLRWTEHTTGFTQAVNEESLGAGPYFSNPNCAAGYAAANAVYAADSWSSFPTNDVYYCVAPIWYSSGQYGYLPNRRRGSGQVTNVSTALDSKLRMYGLPSYYPGWLVGVATWYDIDSLGAQQDKLLFMNEEVTASKNATRISPLFDPSSINPYFQAGVNCSNQQVYNIRINRSEVRWLYNWEFTNEN